MRLFSESRQPCRSFAAQEEIDWGERGSDELLNAQLHPIGVHRIGVERAVFLRFDQALGRMG